MIYLTTQHLLTYLIYYLGVAQIELWKRLVLTQMCNRHAIRANINKASKQAQRGECLPCERLVKGKRHVGKKALLARHFIALLRSQKLIRIFSIFTSSKFGSLNSRDEIYKKIFAIFMSGFGNNKITSNEP